MLQQLGISCSNSFEGWWLGAEEKIRDFKNNHPKNYICIIILYMYKLIKKSTYNVNILHNVNTLYNIRKKKI
jgi:hypothetical protein